MYDKLKIAVIGAGSIGSKHIENLLHLGCENIIVYDYSKKILERFGNRDKITTISDLHALTTEKLDAVLICSPTNLHIEHCLLFAEKNIPFFVEKPLSDNLASGTHLIEVVKKNNLITMVGCNMLFDPSVKWIKKHIENENSGKVLTVNAYFRHYLPNMRNNKGNDNYAYHYSTGGGVLLDTGVHEIQYLTHLFGKIKQVDGFSNNIGLFNTDIDEISNWIILHETGVITTLQMDFVSRIRLKGIEVTTDKETLVWREEGKPPRLSCHISDGNTPADTKQIDINMDISDPFIEEIKHFLNCVIKGEETIYSVAKARDDLEVILNLRNGWIKKS